MDALMDRMAVTARLDDNPAYRGTVHDAATAQAQGFRAALIPGAFLLDYASRLALARWGRPWLGSGLFVARFRRPVFDGDRLTLTLGAEAEGRCPLAIMSDGELVMEGSLGLDQAALVAPEPCFEPHVVPRPSVAPGGIAEGQRFGTDDRILSADDLAASRAAMGQDDPLYAREDIAHLAALVRLGMSDVLRSFAWPSAPVFTAVEGRLLAPVRARQRIRTSATVVETFERKGRHYFVSEEWIWADDRPAVVQRRTNLYAEAPS